MPLELKKNKIFSREDLKIFIIRWSNTFALDKWFRDKYKIRFGSKKHKESNFLDIKFEYEEELLFKLNYIIEKENEEELQYYYATGEYLKKKEEKQMSKEEIDEAFQNLDINLFNQNLSKT